MSASAVGDQRPDVDKKYKNLYSAIAGYTRIILDSDEVQGMDNAARFEFLKENLDAVWALIAAGTMKGKPSWAEFSRLRALYNDAPIDWVERGVQKHGPARAFNKSERRHFTDTLVRFLPSDSDLIFELGCGWGHRMFELWRNGGPQNALYLGGDRSPHCNDILRQIRVLFPEMKVAGFSFDFLNPAFGPLPFTPSKIGIFTCHAIEQILHVGTGFFDQLLARFPEAEITGVHLEPIGFQIAQGDELAKFEKEKQYAEKQLYNQDLFEQILNHSGLRLVFSDTRIISLAETNTTSVAVWTRK